MSLLNLLSLQPGLIVSCQAPAGSPMHEPSVIAAMATAAVNQGAIAVRIESPAHVEAVRSRVSVPIIGLWKQQIPGFEVYITPQFHHAQTIAQAGADLIAIDATLRPRPDGETLERLIARIHTELGMPVMADVDTLEAAIAAEKAGADVVGTTLYGYTEATHDRTPPGFDLLSALVKTLQVPVICEGGVASAQAARQAIDLGAAAVVVGTAITGVDLQVKAYQSALRAKPAGRTIATIGDRSLTLFETAQPHAYIHAYLDAQLTQAGLSYPEVVPFFTPPGNAEVPLDILLQEGSALVGGIVGFTRWNWLFVKMLWVQESLRHQGCGSRLLQLAEQIAIERGCIGSRLNTLSFQAQGFYEKVGYEIIGQLDDYPPGQTHYFLCKRLQVSSPSNLPES